MSRRRRTAAPAPGHTNPEFGETLAMPQWVDVGGRRTFVVDFTPGGFPIGIFEDEIDREWTDEPEPWVGDGIW